MAEKDPKKEQKQDQKEQSQKPQQKSQQQHEQQPRPQQPGPQQQKKEGGYERVQITQQGRDGDFTLTFVVFDKNGLPKPGVIVRISHLDSSHFEDLPPTDCYGKTIGRITFSGQKKQVEILFFGTSILPRRRFFFNRKVKGNQKESSSESKTETQTPDIFFMQVNQEMHITQIVEKKGEGNVVIG